MFCENINRFAAIRGPVVDALLPITKKPKIAAMLAALLLWGSGSLLAQTFTTLFLFGGGGSPRGTLVEGTDGNLYGTTYGSGGRNNGMIFKITPGGSFTMLHQGGTFEAGLTLGTDGNFYGTSVAGGPGDGFVFKITPNGTFTTLYAFPRSFLPGDLVQASDRNFYGTRTSSCKRK